MYQKTTIIGNLGRDPEMKYTPQGKAVTSFSVATSEKWTGQDGEKNERTIWFRVSVFDRQAESCNEYLRKGSKVYVEGKLQGDQATGGPRIWNDKDGNPRASFEIVASTVKFLSSKNEGGTQAVDESDIPF